MKDWDIKIYRGILTGYNNAFIIDGKKKDELIAEDPKSAEIIRPILRGRDIKRYGLDNADIYLIATFPSKHYDIDEYPAVKEHLLSFGYERLEQNGEKGARKKTGNKWFETQDSICYWNDFSKQKIVWGEISDKPKFSIDLNGQYMNEATTFLMVGESLLFLLAYLNSSISEYYFSKIGTTTGVGTIRWKKYTIEQLLVPRIGNRRITEYEKLVLKVLENVAIKKDSHEYIELINKMIYQEFGFTQEEISVIENL